MGVNVQIIRGRYYLAVYKNGHRHYESLHLKRSDSAKENRELDRLAEICRSKRSIQLLGEEYELIDEIGMKMPLYDYVESIAATKGEKNHYGKALRYLDKFPEGRTIRLCSVTTEWLREWQSFLLSQDISQNTAKHYDDAIRCALNQAVRERKIARNPAAGLRAIPETDVILDVLSLEEIKKLMETPVGGALGCEAKDAFLFACFTGLRISDIRRLKWRDIDGDKIRMLMSKTKKALEVPLHPTAARIIGDREGCLPDEYVFPLVATTKTNCITYFDAWAARAGMYKKLGWHTARRTFATLEVAAGVDQYIISKLLGQKSTKHTAVYSQVPITVKKEAIDRLPDLGEVK